MPSFDDLLAARKSAKPKYADVPVMLDADVSDEIARLSTQLEALDRSTDKRATKSDGSKELRTQLEALRSEFAESMVTLRFTQLPGDDWADLTARHPFRAGAVVDMQYGYNLDAVIMEAAPLSGGRVDGETVVPLKVDAKATPPIDQWADLFTTISGHEFEAIRDAIWSLNEWGPAQRLAQAKKALAGSLAS